LTTGVTAVPDDEVRVHDEDLAEVSRGDPPLRGTGAMPLLVASLVPRADRYTRAMRLRDELAGEAAGGALAGLGRSMHSAGLRAWALRVAGRWACLRRTGAGVGYPGGGVAWRPAWRLPLVALAVLPVLLAGGLLAVTLGAVAVVDLAMHGLGARGRTAHH
jgi:hypothetical protein